MAASYFNTIKSPVGEDKGEYFVISISLEDVHCRITSIWANESKEVYSLLFKYEVLKKRSKPGGGCTELS